VLVGIAVAQVTTAIVGGAIEWWTLSPTERSPKEIFALLGSAAITVVVGLAAFFYGRRYSTPNVTRREAVLAVVVIWVGASFFGGLPFVFGAGTSLVDAFFETVSGLTTTGATIITDIDGELVKGQLGRHGGLSYPLLLWRSLIQWLGGMGIVVLFVAVFPSVGAGAKHMFKGEVPGTTAEGLKPRIAETSFTLWKLYAGLTALEAVLLVSLGMTPFEAVCHAFTTMSTGGFSTRDSSIGGFDSYGIDVLLSTFMLIGSLNYGLFYVLLRGRTWRGVFRNTELRAFCAMSFVFTVVLTIGILPNHHDDFIESFRYAYFMVGTTMSSTGYGTDDYMAYSQPMLMVIVLMMFIGGCSGSTAGGIKAERIVLMAKVSWAEFRESFHPAVVHVIRMGRTAVPKDVLQDVAVFVGVFMFCVAFGVLFVSLTDPVPLSTAFGATLSCLSNMGPAPWYQGSDNFASYTDAAKLFFSLAMLLGRLEFFTLFALLIPDFWRR
jgi:trk system potassium uptake protein TrkH